MGVLCGIGLDDEEMAELAEKFSEYKRWFDLNYEKIEKSYVNKFIAIEDNVIMESDEDIDALVKKLKEKNKNPDTLLIELVNPKDFILII